MGVRHALLLNPLAGLMGRLRNHPNREVRQLLIQYDIITTSVYFQQLKNSQTFLAIGQKIKTLTERSVELELSQDLSNEEYFPVIDESLDLEDTLQETLGEIYVEPLTDIFLQKYGRTMLCLVLDKMLDPKSSIDDFILFLDKLEITDVEKVHLLRGADIAKGTFKYYDVRQLLRTICSHESLSHLTDEIAGLDPAEKLVQIRSYVTSWYNKVRAHIESKTPRSEIRTLDERVQLYTSKQQWRNEIRGVASNVQSFDGIESAQITELACTYLRNRNTAKLIELLDDGENLRKLRLDYRPVQKNILEIAQESSSPELYNFLLAKIVRKIEVARANSRVDELNAIDKGAPDFLYRLFKAATSDAGKNLIPRATGNILTYNKIERISAGHRPRSIFSLNTLSAGYLGQGDDQYEWLKKIIKFGILEFVSKGIETIEQIATHYFNLPFARFCQIYSLARVQLCTDIRMKPVDLAQSIDIPNPRLKRILNSPECWDVIRQGVVLDELTALYHQNLEKFNFLVFDPKVRAGYKIGAWDFKSLARFELSYLKNCVNESTSNLVKAGYTLGEIQDLHLNNREKFDKLTSDPFQYFFKMGANKCTIEFLLEYAPEKLRVLKQNAQQAFENGQNFCNFYFENKNRGLQPIPVLSIYAALFSSPPSFAHSINLARRRDNDNSPPPLEDERSV